jgi:xanthine dehydrogenase YagT iron-sulfur-binding subunit
MNDECKGVTRRGFLCAAASGAVYPLQADAAPAGRGDPPQGGGLQDIRLRINGQDYALSVDPRTTLLDTVRDHAGLTGTKKGCAHGQCGACTVHLDGRPVLSCLTLAIMSDGHAITTIEGLSGAGALHPVQQAFIDQDAFQCGYCTPGQIMSAAACIREGHAVSGDGIREYMSGNLCRCAAYPNIVAAIEQARDVGERS